MKTMDKTLARLEENYPGITKFYEQKKKLLLAAFILRIFINISGGVIGIISGNGAAGIAQIVVSLLVVGMFYVAMLNGNWKWSFLMFLWAGAAFVDAAPFLPNLSQYYAWFSILIVIELLAGVFFLIVAIWMCASKQRRDFSAVASYAQQGEMLKAQNTTFVTIPPLGEKLQAQGYGRVCIDYELEGHRIIVDSINKKTARLIIDGDVSNVCQSDEFKSNVCVLATQVDSAQVKAYFRKIGWNGTWVYLDVDNLTVCVGKLK